MFKQEPEPVFGNVYGAKESIRPAYVAWRAGTSNRVVVLVRQAGNRFLGSCLKVLQILGSAVGGRVQCGKRGRGSSPPPPIPPPISNLFHIPIFIPDLYIGVLYLISACRRREEEKIAFRS